MRVISGTARGRKLISPEGEDIRPTTDNVKEAIFNIIQFDIEGRRVLDLFGGTGQLSVECLSRGAAGAVILDTSRKSISVIKENLKRTGLSAEVICGDAIEYIRHCGQFGIIFIDPPYDSDLYEKALNNINLFDILDEGGIIVCESRKDRILPQMTEPYYLKKEYSYGKIKLSVFSRHCDEGKPL